MDQCGSFRCDCQYLALVLGCVVRRIDKARAYTIQFGRLQSSRSRGFSYSADLWRAGCWQLSFLCECKYLEVPYQRTFGPFAGALPDFHKINNAAYWDYQREKVFVRTIKTTPPDALSSKACRNSPTARQGHESSRRHPHFLRSLRIDQDLESRMSITNDRRYHFFAEGRPQTNNKVCDPTISLRRLPPRNGSPSPEDNVWNQPPCIHCIFAYRNASIAFEYFRAFEICLWLNDQSCNYKRY